MSERREYTSHNFDSINGHVDGVLSREAELARLKRARANKAHVFNALYLAIGLALAMLVLAFAYRIYSGSERLVGGDRGGESMQPSATTAHSEKPAQTVIAEKESVVIVEKEVEVPVHIPINDGNQVIREFTIFHDEKVTGVDGIELVTLGARYASSLEKFPDYQWCYTDNKRNSVSSAHVKLAEKKSQGVVSWLPISSEDALLYGADIKNLEAAKRFCKFISRPPDQEQEPIGLPSGSLLGSGSGFVINKNGNLVTNAHVVEGCSSLRVKNPKDTSGFAAQLVSANQSLDVAVLKVPISSMSEYAVFAKTIEIGSDVAAFGYPLSDTLGKDLKVTKGNISSMSGISGDPRFLQFTAPIQPGSSGGIVVDSHGHAVGISTARLEDEQLVNFAVKGTVVQSFLAEKNIDFFAVDGMADIPPIAESVAKAEQYTKIIECYK